MPTTAVPMKHRPRTCHLRDEWRQWPDWKVLDAAYMICPSCGIRGCHVESGDWSAERRRRALAGA